MRSWMTATVAAVLWAIALFFSILKYKRIGRSIHRSHLQGYIRSSFLRAEELEAQVAAGSNDEEVVICWAMLAEQAQDWPEAMRRAEMVMLRFPDLLEGPLLKVRALRAMGDRPRAEKLARKCMYYFPHDLELLFLRLEMASARKDWPAVLKIAAAIKRAAPTSAHPLLLKINALFEIGDLKRIEKALVAAEAEFPENPEIAELWDRYEAILAGPEKVQSGS
jgi:tetratricopeptide (TPR) repeat protein